MIGAPKSVSLSGTSRAASSLSVREKILMSMAFLGSTERRDLVLLLLDDWTSNHAILRLYPEFTIFQIATMRRYANHIAHDYLTHGQLEAEAADAA